MHSSLHLPGCISKCWRLRRIVRERGQTLRERGRRCCRFRQTSCRYVYWYVPGVNSPRTDLSCLLAKVSTAVENGTLPHHAHTQHIPEQCAAAVIGGLRSWATVLGRKLCLKAVHSCFQA